MPHPCQPPRRPGHRRAGRGLPAVWVILLVVGGLILNGLLLGGPTRGVLPAAWAHPVPRNNYDRTAVATITPTRISVAYTLELDEWTVFEDLRKHFDDLVDVRQLLQPRDWHAAYARVVGPILADGLVLKVDGQVVPLTLHTHRFALTDSLRYDFEFVAPLDTSDRAEHLIQLTDTNFENAPGKLDWSLAVAGLTTLQYTAPSAALKARAPIDQLPGDRARLRLVAARVTADPHAKPPPEVEPPPTVIDGHGHSHDPDSADAVPAPAPPPAPPPGWSPWSQRGLIGLLDTSYGVAVLLLLAVLFGAVHALTPGHGKAMVAAYLVAERGTVRHALYLGLIVTLTHTGSVIVLAAVLYWLFPDTVPANVQIVLGFVGGLLLAGLGVWLLLKRLAGQVDHVHWFGHDHHHDHHHHHHGHHHHDHHHPTYADRHHSPQSAPHPSPDAQPTTNAVGGAAGVGVAAGAGGAAGGSQPGWLGLLVLGISGGIVPCWDAVALLGLTLATQRLWLGVPLLLAFSLGLAAVLVALGVAVVRLTKLGSGQFAESRWFRALPVFSAMIITGIGVWLCADSLRPH
jgi:nickel/cobalt exporter